MELVLEVREQEDRTLLVGNELIFGPVTGEDYWRYRVKVSGEQAIVGFPKFGTVGIGFAVEADWNTNLPSFTPPDVIYEHIKRNKGDENIADEDCVAAIMMIQEAIAGGR